MVRAADRTPAIWLLACVGLAVTLFGIGWHQPVLGDMWFPLLRGEQGVPFTQTLRGYVNSFVNGNPRIGQLLMIWGGWSGALHQLLNLVLFVGILLAAGRLASDIAWVQGESPLAKAGHVGMGGVVCTALFWLIHGSPGQAFFYFPISTNYLFAVLAYCIYFVAYLRGGPSVSSDINPALRFAQLAALAVLAFVCGLGGEHLGPAAIALSLAVLAQMLLIRWVRRSDVAGPAVLRQAVMFTSLCLGYLALFNAPGQSKRYGGKAAEAGLGDPAVLQQRLSEALSVAFPNGLSILAVAALAVILLGVMVTQLARLRPHRDRDGSIIMAAITDRALISAVFAAGFVFALFATLLASPIVADRLLIAFHFAVALLLSATAIWLIERHRVLAIPALALTALALIPELATQRSLQLDYAREFEAHEQLIASALEDGKTHVDLPGYTVNALANSRYIFPEFPRYYASANTNVTAASLYDLGSVRLLPNAGVAAWAEATESGVSLVYDACGRDVESWGGPADPYGVIVCSESYDMLYVRGSGEWTVSGARESTDGGVPFVFSATRGGPDPMSGYLSHWGAPRLYDANGIVYDTNWNRLGRLRPGVFNFDQSEAAK